MSRKNCFISCKIELCLSFPEELNENACYWTARRVLPGALVVFSSLWGRLDILVSFVESTRFQGASQASDTDQEVESKIQKWIAWSLVREVNRLVLWCNKDVCEGSLNHKGRNMWPPWWEKVVRGGFAKAVASELSFEGWTEVYRQTGGALGQRAGGLRELGRGSEVERRKARVLAGQGGGEECSPWSGPAACPAVQALSKGVPWRSRPRESPWGRKVRDPHEHGNARLWVLRKEPGFLFINQKTCLGKGGCWAVRGPWMF